MPRRKPKPGRKVRVDFRRNRAAPRREGDQTRRYRADADRVADQRSGESVRAKGDLSRKRTIIVDGRNEQPAADLGRHTAGVVTAVHGLVCRVDDEQGRNWDCTVRRVLRTLLIEQRSPVTVGDRVWFTPEQERSAGRAPSSDRAEGGRSDENPAEGGQAVRADEARIAVIEGVEPRQTSLSRRDRRGREHTIVANADQLLIVGSVFEPMIKPHLIDRYIVAALKGGLLPVITLNKIDLYDAEATRAAVAMGDDDERATSDGDERANDDPDERAMDDDDESNGSESGDAGDDELRGGESRPEDTPALIDELLDDDTLAAEPLTVEGLVAEFRGLGYPCICTSATAGTGLDDLREALRGHMTVIAGQSGVGKSSLINALQPGLNLTTAEVSESNDKGQHTTTFARLLRLDFGGYVVDTPGIRSFGFWDVQVGELEARFVEFLPFLSRCRYRDCLHTDAERGCGVAAAVEAGRISPRRYRSYVKMVREAGE